VADHVFGDFGPFEDCGQQLIAPMRGGFEQVLVPTLAKGDVVFADNLQTHKIDGVRQAIAAVGATIRYLPAYSPDLNPIEMAFSKLKAALRKGAKRTVKELWRLISKLIKSFAPDQCANYFCHAGYGR